MNEIEELERRWRQYRSKKYRPWIVSAGFGIFIVAGLSYYLISSSSVPQAKTVQLCDRTNGSIKIAKPEKLTRISNKERSLTGSSTFSSNAIPERTKHIVDIPQNKKESETKVEKKVPEAISVKPQVKKEKIIELTPDTTFLQNIASADSFNHRHHQKKSPVKPVEEEKIVSPKSMKRRSVEKVVSSSQKKVGITSSRVQKDQRKSLQLISTQTNNTLQHIIDRFQQTRDPKLALYIAQSYFKKREYQQAVRWSIMANSIEPSNEKSWILYARAKVKLGHKNEAIKALKIYLNQYASRRVETYLEYLESLQ